MQHVGHDAEINPEAAQRIAGFDRAIACGREYRYLLIARGGGERICFCSGLFRCHKDARDGIAARKEGLEHRFAEGLLTDDGNPHRTTPSELLLWSRGSREDASRQSVSAAARVGGCGDAELRRL